VSWNTTQTSNGQHTLTAVARDAAGNTTTSQPVTVTVLNVILQPSPGTGPGNSGGGAGKGKPPKPAATKSLTETLSISGVRTSPRRVCKNASPRCESRTTLRFRLSQPARVVVVFERVSARTRRARTSRLVRMGRRGVNRVRLNARGIERGRYRIMVKPVGMALARPARRARLSVG
jgi:hypothetical protein